MFGFRKAAEETRNEFVWGIGKRSKMSSFWVGVEEEKIRCSRRRVGVRMETIPLGGWKITESGTCGLEKSGGQMVEDMQGPEGSRAEVKMFEKTTGR